MELEYSPGVEALLRIPVRIPPLSCFSVVVNIPLMVAIVGLLMAQASKKGSFPGAEISLLTPAFSLAAAAALSALVQGSLRKTLLVLLVLPRGSKLPKSTVVTNTPSLRCFSSCCRRSDDSSKESRGRDLGDGLLERTAAVSDEGSGEMESDGIRFGDKKRQIGRAHV